MINLLPPDLKEDYAYGRRNTVLRRWATALGLGLAGVAVITFAGLFVMQQSITAHAKQAAAARRELEVQQLEETQRQAKDITGNLRLAVNVLSREVLFSQLLTQIAKVTPASVNLTDLSITSVKGAIEIKANARDYNGATQLQINLQDPANKVFTKADIQSINCDGNDPDYPCSVTIRALFSDNNPFLFINTTKAAP